MEELSEKPLKLIDVRCCICENSDAAEIANGEDFEYRTSPDTFSVSECNTCGLVYLNPRPDVSEFERIYPASYHAFDFSEKDFGFVYKVRSRLEAKRVLSWCKDLPDDARIIDTGCGDGFHLSLLKEYGNKSWTLEGIDIDSRAAQMAKDKGFTVHVGSIDEVELPKDSYDLAIMVQTIEHVAEPGEVLRSVREILKPGGKIIVVTDNTESFDFKLFKKSHWGGYHFPRHWNLFNSNSLRLLSEKFGFEVEKITTQVSPVNWVYSFHNRFVDHKRAKWLTDRFTLRSTVSLSAFTMLDIVLQKFGRGGLLNATLRKPV
ncbi:MAG: class I SAM-dependent methyltransferase [Pyrinomonadaceae bacterium]